MRRLILMAVAAAVLVSAQDPVSLSGWQFYKELATNPDGLAALSLDVEVLAGARKDGADLRLYDATGRGIPYFFRVLRDGQLVQRYEATEVSRATAGDVAEMMVDLGEEPRTHNQVELTTQGQNSLREVSVFGSVDFQNWSSLIEQSDVSRFVSTTDDVTLTRIRYRPSNSRYIRVTASADTPASEAPVLISAKAGMLIIVRGQEESFSTTFGERQEAQLANQPASQYRIDLPGRLPVQALRFSTPTEIFNRQYRLDSIEGDNILPIVLSQGKLTRPDASAPNKVSMGFAEVWARQLQLTIVDDDAPLAFYNPSIQYAARQLLVDLSSAESPLRLYYGNPTAESPDYDVQQWLTPDADQKPPVLALASQELNPAYVTPPSPLSEQAPWLVYVVTGVACLGLLVILRSLVFHVNADD